MTSKEFLELLGRVQAERLLSSEADRLFGAAKGDRYSLDLNFIQSSSAFGRQIHSNYDNGYKFECTTDEDLEVSVLFAEKDKELVDSLQGQNSQGINVEVLGYDILYQKPVLGYFEKELPAQNLIPDPIPEPNAVQDRKDEALSILDEGEQKKTPVRKTENVEKKQLPSVSNLPNSKPHHWTKGSNQIGKRGASGTLEPILERIHEANDLPPQPKSRWLPTAAVVASILTILIVGPIVLSLGKTSTQTTSPTGGASRKEITANVFYSNFRKAERSFERGQLAAARQQARKALYFINRKDSGLGGDDHKIYNVHLHTLLGRIYDRVGDSYQSCKSFSKAKTYWHDQKRVFVDPKRGPARNLEQSIDKQLLKLKEQGMGGLIDEGKKTLNPVDEKWLDSVIRMAIEDSQLEVVARPVAEILVLNQTKEPYSGWVKSFHEAGSIKELIHYAQGQRHGHYRSWEIDGTVASIATYHKGKKTGLNPTFGEDGKAYNIPMYKDGKLLGPISPSRTLPSARKH